MNKVHIDINRIEFSVTHTCSGRCKHCSVSTDETAVGSVDAEAAVRVVRQIVGRYAVESVMTFGGESLLYPDTVCTIHSAARDAGIPIRQIITNACFSRDEQKIEKVAEALCHSGVNDILLSVDAFHQEYIPIDPVLCFAKALMKNGAARFRVHPAWLVNSEARNPYNEETKRLLNLFGGMGIETSAGNNIFPAGNALKYLIDYFPRRGETDWSVPCGQMPYTGRIDEVKCVSVNPNGDLELCSFAIGNVYKDDVLHILDGYDPYGNPVTQALLAGGAGELLKYAERLGIAIDISDCYSSCGVCRKTIRALREREAMLANAL